MSNTFYKDISAFIIHLFVKFVIVNDSLGMIKHSILSKTINLSLK